MKLKNKKTGEIKELRNIMSDMIDNHIVPTLIVIENEWEDVPEEPKVFYVVDLDGEILPSDFEDKTIEKSKELGNYFETKEEAEKAAEKLKAWKRLKDKGFKFDNFVRNAIYYVLSDEEIEKDDVLEDLDLLFGGEE